ncbi:3-oxoacyl-[acyl-carrier protein] reductase [Saccharopolyspora antimicrobica]|uniref:3-oxoacyl-[acyl-carrier protein] reductase n=1 Tax=Saccharopolyspora antimicrobica TaxID=455193 RepID=A0A1I5KK07_9PSEU|nr:SDR family oxidoreductase [Saccharopolyspora antimicrobica]RKT85651.1 3-oxoacyl-[acyl-carrier protein] reductase [Saccharopolyspora antimicrobica]SFO85207.1 3-oxoacyl-[acyl-carrier protein] reductase [Saccharopolyspora antimicrobica]
MNRIVLVTGGSSGIGKAVASRFRASGDTVIITGRGAERLASAAAEIDARPIPCDASDSRQVAALAAELGDHLDVLVNMAGGNTDLLRDEPADLEQLAEAWRANLDANLLSAVLTTSAVLDKLRPGGTIVNVGSIGAEYASTSYGAAKAALAAWSAGLSSEVGPKGLTANLISPGYIEETEFFHGKLSDQRRTALIDATHNGRPGRPGDIAELAHFLASEGARHLTGQTLHVNGGAHTTR